MLTPEFVSKANLPTDSEAQKKLIADWHKRKSEIYKQLIREGRLPGRPGVRRVVQEAHDAGWKLAVASTSAEESVRGVLEYVVGQVLAADFLVLAGDIVPQKKPAPDIYLLTMEKLGISHHEALVVEDSRNGLLSARSAGIHCVVTIHRMKI
jgi:HAD superfamily hydrolase (TIGR01509 family)